MALGLRCFRWVQPGFYNSLSVLTRPVLEVGMRSTGITWNDCQQSGACSTVMIRHFATKKAKAKGKGHPQTRVNINASLVEDIICLEEVDVEMKSVVEALKDNFNKNLNIRTSPGSLDHITVTTGDGKFALNHIGQISLKSPQLILVNMTNFPEFPGTRSGHSLLFSLIKAVCTNCTAAAIKAIRESGMNLNPEVDGTVIRVPIPKLDKWQMTL
ncbi:ribosome-recycling factor, mitochondrial isoform X3 [Monodelphis domestica]|uniref:ribosome-recycling factor, mitochondrial isoform X3 n=1 Tax=Monodelphis domestica TaxID=13616 RepID=UPI00044357C7|nr:ribosome-recycling factor, mitochondrial isoform X3 [Monodelphis domestica]